MNVALIVTDDKGYHEIDISKADYKSPSDLTPAFKLIKKMEDEGWELYNSLSGNSWVFFLRKQRN